MDTALGIWLLEHAVRVPQQRGDVLNSDAERSFLGDIVEQLRPRRSQLEAVLASPLEQVLVGKSDQQKGHPVEPRGAAVCGLPVRGRALIVGSRRLPRGSVVIRESPVESVPLSRSSTGPGQIGPGGVSAETALALRLWQRDRGDIGERLSQGVEVKRVERAILAAAFALVVSRVDGNILELDGALALFAWLGRVRVNAVAVARITDHDGEMDTASVSGNTSRFYDLRKLMHLRSVHIRQQRHRRRTSQRHTLRSTRPWRLP